MNPISIVFLMALIPLFGYMLYISAMRQGRDTKGKYVAKPKKQKVQLFYSELRGGVRT